jgi:Flp pilus assembly protein TadG
VPILRNTSSALKVVRRFGTSLRENRDGMAALEFAIVGPAFIALLLAILYTMFVFLTQQMLETAAQSAGRMLLTGAAQTTTMANGNVGMSASDFKNAICNGYSGTTSTGVAVSVLPLLPSMLSCSRLTVNVTTANSYNVGSTAPPTFTYNASGVLTSTGTGYSYQSGGSGSSRIVVLQLIYLWPTGTGPLGLTMANQPNGNRMIVATSVFTTEAYSCSGSQTSC